MSDVSLIKDEFHRASKPYPLVRLISPSLAENRMSGREKLLMERRCRICHVKVNLTRHHLVPHAWFLQRRQGLRSMRNANANIVPLCASCHQVVDGANDPVGRLQKRSALRARLGPNEVAFILQVRGRDWFDEHYPKHP